jgi:hypothetical protein
MSKEVFGKEVSDNVFIKIQELKDILCGYLLHEVLNIVLYSMDESSLDQVLKKVKMDMLKDKIKNIK